MTMCVCVLTGESKQVNLQAVVAGCKFPVTVSSLMFYEGNPIHLYYPRVFQCLGRIQFVHIYCILYTFTSIDYESQPT